MQGQLDDIAGREGVLRQVREEEFVDDARTCDTYRTFLFPAGCVATITRQETPSGPTGIAGQS